jgi:acetate kinase
MMNKIPREEVFAITLHLGNGCSACAISRGNSIDTSMGMTPLEGLVMGTRAGDIDPAIIDYLSQKEGMSLHEVDSILNRSSGLLGISGLTHDMRELIDEEREHDDRRAKLAIEIFCYRVRKYIGAYITSILSSGVEPKEIALIFTGGIGENSPEIRKRVCAGLHWLGLDLDEDENMAMTSGREGPIGAGRLRPYVIPTNEELLIARDTVRAIKHVPQRY